MSYTLFLKSDPIPGESIYGYLTRLGHVLGYRSPAWMYDVFPDAFPSGSVRHLLVAQNLAFLAEKLRISLSSLDAMRLPQRDDGSHMCRGQMIARHDINAMEEYFCPSCTRERKTHLLVWHLAFVTVCPIHNCRLVSRCETCFHRLNLGSVLEGICAGCGKSIHPLAPNSEQSGPIVGRLLSLIGGIDGTTVPQDVPEVLQGIGLSDAVALILCFGRAMEPIRKRGRNTARRKMEQRLLIGFEICENWHSSISKVLDQEFSRPKSAKSMKSGAFHKHFIRSKYPHVRRMAIAALWGYERQHQIAQARNGSAVNLEEYENLADVALRLGISKITLTRRREYPGSLFPRIKWKRSIYIHKSEVEWLNRCLKECISAHELSEALNIADRHQIQAFYNHHVFALADPSLQLDHRMQLFHRPTVEAFLRYLEKLPERETYRPEVEVEWRTAKAMFLSRRHSSINFVKAITTGNLRPTGRLKGKCGLLSLVFDRSSVGTCASSGTQFR